MPCIIFGVAHTQPGNWRDKKRSQEKRWNLSLSLPVSLLRYEKYLTADWINRAQCAKATSKMWASTSSTSTIQMCGINVSQPSIDNYSAHLRKLQTENDAVTAKTAAAKKKNDARKVKKKNRARKQSKKKWNGFTAYISPPVLRDLNKLHPNSLTHSPTPADDSNESRPYNRISLYVFYLPKASIHIRNQRMARIWALRKFSHTNFVFCQNLRTCFVFIRLTQTGLCSTLNWMGFLINRMSSTQTVAKK